MKMMNCRQRMNACVQRTLGSVLSCLYQAPKVDPVLAWRMCRGALGVNIGVNTLQYTSTW